MKYLYLINPSRRAIVCHSCKLVSFSQCLAQEEIFVRCCKFDHPASSSFILYLQQSINRPLMDFWQAPVVSTHHKNDETVNMS